MAIVCCGEGRRHPAEATGDWLMLNVQSVIEERFPELLNRARFFRRPLLGALRMLFHEKEFQQFGERYPHLTGIEFIEEVFSYFDFSFSVRHNEKERIPVSGRVVIIANHPIGTLDGMALLKLVSDVRQDVKVMANDFLMSIQPLHDLLMPVDNIRGGTARERLRAVHQHLENEGALIIFPAGEVSRMGPSGIRDGKWRTGFLRIAEATQSPILPVLVDARNSVFFYSLSFVSKPLSTLWLIREMFKHARNSVAIRIGEPVMPADYRLPNVPMKTLAKIFKKQVYRLAKGKDSLFRTQKAIAHPENRILLRKDILQCELLGETKDHKKIYLYRHTHDSSLMREIGRLREEAFRLVGEGTGGRRDMDRFDRSYFHIVLWDDQALEVVGAYRLCGTGDRINDAGQPGIYSATLFQFQPEMRELLEEGLELGRSFVQPRYWGTRSLEYLWYGISAFLNKNPQYRYLLGPVSISNSYSREAKDLLVYFYSRYFASECSGAIGNLPYVIDPLSRDLLDLQFHGLEGRDAFVQLKAQLSHLGYSVPTLYKQYSELCEPGGASFMAFNVDPDFSDCIDGLVVVDLNRILDSKRKRYNLLSRAGSETTDIPASQQAMSSQMTVV